MLSKISFQLPFITAAAFACTLVSSPPIQARPVAFAFRGTVDQVFDGLVSLSPRVVVGAPFRGVYVFESTTPNTAEPGGEGELGLYHHDRRPAGVLVHVGGMTFASVLRHPNFDIIVNNDFGFAGADEYGFFSYKNRSLPQVNGDLLHINWSASTFAQQVFSSADLPLVPPDLSLLGGGEFKIYGECTPCASPAAFFRITGPVTSLVRVRAGSWWPSDSFDPSLAEAELAQESVWGATVPEPACPWASAILIMCAGILRRRR